MFLYIITFLIGFLLDSERIKIKSKNTVTKIYVLWVFIFFCFGYMTGSDWRSYETFFEAGAVTNEYDQGFAILIRILRFFTKDFFLALGILKCFYLWSCLSLLKSITKYWLTGLAILMPVTLLFLLIHNPLRFMVSLFFYNMALLMLKKNYTKWLSILFIILGVFVHGASIFCIAFIPFILTGIFSKIKNIVLLIIYVSAIAVSLETSYLVDTFNIATYLLRNNLATKDYAFLYSINSTDGLFTIGSIFNIILFLVVLFYRDKILQTDKGNEVFNGAMTYFFAYRILLRIPLGYRYLYFISPWFVACFAEIIHTKGMVHHLRSGVTKCFKLGYIAYLCILMSTMLLGDYAYIPYSNSIPYILTEHKPYSERFYYNYNAYRERTGHSIR